MVVEATNCTTMKAATLYAVTMTLVSLIHSMKMWSVMLERSKNGGKHATESVSNLQTLAGRICHVMTKCNVTRLSMYAQENHGAQSKYICKLTCPKYISLNLNMLHVVRVTI